MKRLFSITIFYLLLTANYCFAQNETYHHSQDMARISKAVAGIPLKDENTSICDTTAFFPYLYNIMPYHSDGWQLHSGLNAQLGMSVTASFGKHAPKGVGIGSHATFLYAVSLTSKLSAAAGIGYETFDWGGFKVRNAELMEIAAYKVNDCINVCTYGSKSILDDKQRRFGHNPNFNRDKWGGSVDFNLGKNVFVQFCIEQTRFY